MKKANKQGGPFQFRGPILTLAERKILLRKQEADRDAAARDAAAAKTKTQSASPKKPTVDDEDS